MERFRRSLISCALTIICTSIMLDSSAGAKNRITFWTIEMETERIEVQREIARSFAKKTDIDVDVVPIEESHLPEKIATAAIEGCLPDVIYHPIDFTIGLTQQRILDTHAATDVVRLLDKETFIAKFLNLVQMPSGYAAVPVDGWGQLLLYRKDLFKEKGLLLPDTWDRILQAAQALHNPPRIWGFEIATDPQEIYTQQVFEHFALSNGIRLIGSSESIELNTPAMIQVLEFYKALSRFTPPGKFHWFHARKDYVSGRAAMIIWSPYILDELSGLRSDIPIIPDMIHGKPGYLAANTGFVTKIHGPKGAAQYGQIGCYGITRSADKSSAKKWVMFLLTEGYLDWLSMAPAGKLPIRKGTSTNPNFFTESWKELEIGVTARAKISKLYGRDVTKTIVDSATDFDRWGISREKGGIVARMYETKLIPHILKQYLDDNISAAQAAQIMDERVKALELTDRDNDE